DGRGLHRQPAPVVAGVRASVRHRQRGPRGGAGRTHHDQHRRVRSLRRPRRPAGGGALRATGRCLAAVVRAHGRHRRHRQGRGAGAADTPAAAERRPVRASIGALGRGAVAGGLCRHVLCFRTVWESTFAALGLGRAGGGGRISGFREWTAPFGALSAANWIAMNANHYLHRYGASRELLGWIALNGRAGAARNPAAIYRDPMTMDEYMEARPITTPFGLFDCDVPCDAAVAVVVSDASVAADVPQPAVR